MEKRLFQDVVFENKDYSNQSLSNGEFVCCSFVNCNFSNSDLSYNDFIDCTFQDCNFTLTKLASSGLKNVNFEDCKMVGLDFSLCNDFLFAVSFTQCFLDYSLFFRKKMKVTKFEKCSLREVEFSEADLSGSCFMFCDLDRATFLRTNLENVDFSTAVNYTIDPELNKMKKAKFTFPAMKGLLAKYNLNIC